MAANNITTPERDIDYSQHLWGEVIYGTKEGLQSLGLGQGMAYPGEIGGPKRVLRGQDPRGFATTIERVFWKDGVYCASISFPGRERAERNWTEVAPGVTKCSDMHWCDEYVGTPEALAAAGLVRVDQLPGQPGMRKVRVTIFPDGTIPSGAPTTNPKKKREPGAKTIEWASKTTCRVRVVVSEEEKSRRWEAQKCADREWEARMRALPRPAPLVEVCTDPRAFKDRLAGRATVVMDLLEKMTTYAPGDQELATMWFSAEDMQEIARIREQLIHAISNARVITAGRERPVLRVVK